MSLELSYIKFEKLTGVDVNQFFVDYLDFYERYFPTITRYYEGKIRLEDFTAFDVLKDLQKRTVNILTAFKLQQTAFSDLRDWDLLEEVEKVKVKLQTIAVLSKYLRTSIVTSEYDDGIQNKDYMLKQNQTLRGVSWSVLKSIDPNNEWVDIAIRNDLSEEEYSTSGGVNLKLVYRNPGTINYVESVVDSITGENILGYDIWQLLTYEDDDLSVLDNWATVVQAADILLNLAKNDNPEFYKDGIPSNLLGNTTTAFAYPILFRELTNVFAKDDTIVGFQINDIKVEPDAIKMEMNIETILGQMIKGELSL